MVGMSLPVDGSCDRELKAKGISDMVIGDLARTRVASCQTSSGNTTANAASTISSQGPSPWTMVILEMHYNCSKVRKTMGHHWDSHCVGRVSLCHGFVY